MNIDLGVELAGYGYGDDEPKHDTAIDCVPHGWDDSIIGAMKMWDEETAKLARDAAIPKQVIDPRDYLP